MAVDERQREGGGGRKGLLREKKGREEDEVLELPISYCPTSSTFSLHCPPVMGRKGKKKRNSRKEEEKRSRKMVSLLYCYLLYSALPPFLPQPFREKRGEGGKIR